MILRRTDIVVGLFFDLYAPEQNPAVRPCSSETRLSRSISLQLRLFILYHLFFWPLIQTAFDVITLFFTSRYTVTSGCFVRTRRVLKVRVPLEG